MPDRPDPVTTPETFVASLARMGFSICAFARWMAEMGDDRDPNNIRRHIQRMAAGDCRISGEMRVLLALLERTGGVGQASSRLRHRSPVARRHLRAARRAEMLTGQAPTAASME